MQHTRVERGGIPFSRIVTPNCVNMSVKCGRKIGRFVNATVAFDGLAKGLHHSVFPSGDTDAAVVDANAPVLVRIRKKDLCGCSDSLDSVFMHLTMGGLDMVVSERRCGNDEQERLDFIVDGVHPVYGGPDGEECVELCCTIGCRIDCWLPTTATRIDDKIPEDVGDAKYICVNWAEIRKHSGSGCGDYVAIGTTNAYAGSFCNTVARFHLFDSDVVESSCTFGWVVDAVREGLDVVIEHASFIGMNEKLLVRSIVPVYREGNVVELFCTTGGGVSLDRPFYEQEAWSRPIGDVAPKQEVTMTCNGLGRIIHHAFKEIASSAVCLSSFDAKMESDGTWTFRATADAKRSSVSVEGCEVFVIDGKDFSDGKPERGGFAAWTRHARSVVLDQSCGSVRFVLETDSGEYSGIVSDVILDEYLDDPTDESVGMAILVNAPLEKSGSSVKFRVTVKSDTDIMSFVGAGLYDKAVKAYRAIRVSLFAKCLDLGFSDRYAADHAVETPIYLDKCCDSGERWTIHDVLNDFRHDI